MSRSRFWNLGKAANSSLGTVLLGNRAALHYTKDLFIGYDTGCVGTV